MDEHITTADAARILGERSGYLKLLRHRDQGPNYIRRGSRIFYLKADVERWRLEHRSPVYVRTADDR